MKPSYFSLNIRFLFLIYLDPDSNPDSNPDPKSGSETGSETGFEMFISVPDRIRIWPKVSDPYGSGSATLVKTQDPDPRWTSGSFFRERKKQFLGLKYLNSLMRMRIRESLNLDPGWKKIGSGKNIPDPQQWISHLDSNHRNKQKKLYSVCYNYNFPWWEAARWWSSSHAASVPSRSFVFAPHWTGSDAWVRDTSCRGRHGTDGGNSPPQIRSCTLRRSPRIWTRWASRRTFCPLWEICVSEKK